LRAHGPQWWCEWVEAV